MKTTAVFAALLAVLLAADFAPAPALCSQDKPDLAIPPGPFRAEWASLEHFQAPGAATSSWPRTGRWWER